MLQNLKRFYGDEEGSVFILVAISSLMLIAASGAAIDMSRAQTLQAKISSSLDAAGLAAGATANTIDPQTQATKYFNANFPTHYLGSGSVNVTTTCGDIGGNTVTCTSPSTYTINLAASTTQTTTFMKAVGINSIPVSANSQITRATSGLELALVMDNTGSMQDSVDGGTYSSRHPTQHQPKIDALQCAAAGSGITSTSQAHISCSAEGLVTTGLTDILFGTNNSLNDLFVGVVPFSDMVNVKANVATAIGATFVNNVTSSNRSGMTGCVNSRSPTIASTTDTGITLPSGDVPLTLDISDDPPNSANSYFNALVSSQGDCPDAIVLPMSTQKSDVVAAFQNMSPKGNTNIQLGFAWGWRMLSPNWSGIWGSTPTFTYPETTTTVPLPLPYHTDKMLKVIVLMTDGMNTTGSHSAYTSDPSASQLDNLTQSVCDAIKSKGIIIYTIGFGPSSGINATLLQYCATQNYTGDTSHYFLAPSNAELETAFQQIGNQLANLRVSQ